MALFKINGSVVKKITVKDLDLERNLQSLFVSPRKSLKELEDQKLLRFQRGFSKWSSSSYDNPINDLKKLFLKKVEIMDTGNLKLTVKTEAQGEQVNHIYSDNKDLLKEIKNVLETMIDKRLSEAYHEKIIVYG